MNIQMNDYNIIIDKIFKNNKMIHWALNEQWYIKNDIQYIYKLIYSSTTFLNSYNVSLKERITYIKHYKTDIVKCKYCDNKTAFNENSALFRNNCTNKECKRKQGSERGKKAYENMSDESKKNIKDRFMNYLETRTFSDEHRMKMRMNRKNQVFSKESIQKGIETRRSNGKPWHTLETKKKLSESNKITSNSDEFKKRRPFIYTEATHKKHSETMKLKIANGEFTPCITNSWTHWDAIVNLEDGTVKKFRSNWDAFFWLCNPQLEYEKIRIKYTYQNNWHNYIVDFYDPINKIIYEIKPDSEKNTERNLVKYKFAKKYAKDNNLKYVLITNKWFKKNINKIDLTNHPTVKYAMRQFYEK